MTSRTTPAALVLAAALSACRTAVPGPPPESAGPTTEHAASRAPPADVVYVPYSPTLLVARGQEAFVLLHAILVRTSDGPPALDVAYVASPDLASASVEGAPRRAAAAAALLLEALGPMLPPEVREADVTAVFGAPGTWGVGIEAHGSRDDSEWGTWAMGTANRALVPPLPLPLARPAEGEREAVEAARTFLMLADEGDGDGAWALASATIKSTTSRRSFEEALWPNGRRGSRGERRERYRQYDLHSGAFRTGDVLWSASPPTATSSPCRCGLTTTRNGASRSSSGAARASSDTHPARRAPRRNPRRRRAEDACAAAAFAGFTTRPRTRSSPSWRPPAHAGIATASSPRSVCRSRSARTEDDGGLARGPVPRRGQVFGRFDEAVVNPRAVGGVGPRAFVHPNVLGRIDVAKGFDEHWMCTFARAEAAAEARA